MSSTEKLYGPGVKFDGKKLRWDLLPLEPIKELVRIITFGAKKYAPNNWQNVDPEKYYAAMMRHIAAWRGGQRCDHQSKRPHLGHIICNAVFLYWLHEVKDKNARIHAKKRS
jgi:hypothetical protein